MSKLSDFLASGGSLKPFQDLGTVTGTVNLDLSQYGSFRVVQGAGDITLNVITDPDAAGVFELFFYRDRDWAVSFNGFEFVGNGYQDLPKGTIAGLDYDGVSFSVAAQDGLPIGMAFNLDGTKMYVIGYLSTTVYQYSLTTGFDISTASYDNVSFLFGQDSIPYGIEFNPNGTKMFIIGSSNNNVYQYSLTTGFDISTASYDNVSFAIGTQDTDPYGFTFSTDGTKMFVVGNANDTAYQYSLTTGFDLSTASYDNVSFDYSSQDTQASSILFNALGTRMYIIGLSSDSFHEYNLENEFDISTASYNGVSFSVAQQDNSPRDIVFDSNEQKIFLIGVGSDKIHQYTPGSSGVYKLTQIGNKVTLDTQSTDFSLKDAV